MKIQNQLTDNSVLEEMGRRLTRQRLNLGLTQGEVALRSGLGKRTVERIEAGESAQMESVIRVLRTLGILDRLDILVPEEVGPRPLELLKLKGKERRRASAPQKPTPEDKQAGSGWRWGNDA